MSGKGRSFVLTINNYTDDDVERWNAISEIYKGCKFIFGKEVAPSTGTKHLQGYVRMKNPISFKALTDYFNKRAHIEKAKGNLKQNYDYCSKDGEFVTNIVFDKKKENSYKYFIDSMLHENHPSIENKAIYECISCYDTDDETKWKYEKMRKVMEEECMYCERDYTTKEFENKFKELRKMYKNIKKL